MCDMISLRNQCNRLLTGVWSSSLFYDLEVQGEGGGGPDHATMNFKITLII